MLFNVIDTNSDNMLNKAEFKHKMRSLHLGLEEEELESLFRDLDVNGDSNISYNEFVKQFTAVNTASIIRRIRRILYGASISAETIFNKHTSGQELKLPEFKNLIN
jgi:calmodulin